MSEYRRFVAYIYEYQKGKKGKNTGHVKADARNGVCRIQLRMEPVSVRNGKLRIYGFVRRGESLPVILLGEGMAKNGILESRITTPEEHFGDSGYSLRQICGMWITDGQKEQHITVWDDEPVAVERFTALQEETKGEEQQQFSHWAEEPSGHPEQRFSHSEEEQPAEPRNSKMRESQQEDFQQGGTAAYNAQTESGGNVDMEAEETGGRDEAGEGCSKEEGLSRRWQQFLYHYQGIQPFEDQEISQCIRIAPKDLSFLGPGEWIYFKNPFLLNGYQRYGHLLLGVHKTGRFVLGIPGKQYDMQDRHLARMYGFPEFKKAGGEQADQIVPEGEERARFGYWYHFISDGR